VKEIHMERNPQTTENRSGFFVGKCGRDQEPKALFSDGRDNRRRQSEVGSGNGEKTRGYCSS